MDYVKVSSDDLIKIRDTTTNEETRKEINKILGERMTQPSNTGSRPQWKFLPGSEPGMGNVEPVGPGINLDIYKAIPLFFCPGALYGMQGMPQTSLQPLNMYGGYVNQAVVDDGNMKGGALVPNSYVPHYFPSQSYTPLGPTNVSMGFMGPNLGFPNLSVRPESNPNAGSNIAKRVAEMTKYKIDNMIKELEYRGKKVNGTEVITKQYTDLLAKIDELQKLENNYENYLKKLHQLRQSTNKADVNLNDLINGVNSNDTKAFDEAHGLKEQIAANEQKVVVMLNGFNNYLGRLSPYMMRPYAVYK